MGWDPVSSISAISLACILACLVVQEISLNNVTHTYGADCKVPMSISLCFCVLYLLSARQCHDQVTEFSTNATKTQMQIYG